MKFSHVLTCLCSLVLIGSCSSEDTTAKTETVAPKPKETTTTEKPIIKSPPICEKCACKNETKTLDCSYKKLSTWLTEDEWIQINTTGFETLLFNNNEFEEVKVFPNVSIKTLVLSHNAIVRIEKGAFQNLRALVTLDLSYNNLTSANLKPEVFEGRYSPQFYEPIANLKVLNLGFNQLHSLDPDLFEHFPALETLILAENIFKTINPVTEVAIASISELRVLDLSFLELRDLPNPIFHAPRSLQVLNLEGNLFNKIPNALEHAINLIELNLDENPLDDFVGDNVFPNLTLLEKLSLSECEQLKVIGPGAFSGLPGLKELNLEGNLHLSEIHPNAFSRRGEAGRLEYPLLKKLNLKRCNLSSLEKELLRNWDIQLDISGNKWDCECQNEWLIHDLYDDIRDENPNMASQFVCASPLALKGRRFEDIYTDKNILRCPDKYGNKPESDGRLLMGLLIGLLIGIPIAMGILLVYRRGCFGLFAPYHYEHSRALYKRADFNDDYQI